MEYISINITTVISVICGIEHYASSLEVNETHGKCFKKFL